MMSTAGTAPPATRTANVSKAGSVSVFLLTATLGFFEANLLLDHVAAFTVVRKPGGVSPRSKRTIVARAVNTNTGTTSNDAVGSATRSTSQKGPDGSQGRPVEEKSEQEFTAGALESSELMNKRPSNREQLQGARRGASSAFLATFAPSRTAALRARGTGLTTLVNRAKQRDDTEFLLHDDTTTAEVEQLPVPTKKAAHDTAAVVREGTTGESTRKFTDADENGPSSPPDVEAAGLLTSSRHHEVHSGSVTQASLVQREEAGQGLEVSVVSDTICGEEAKRNKLLNGTVILDFDVWTPERNFGGDDTLGYTLVGAATVPAEDKTLEGPNLVNATQCAAVCAAYYSEKCPPPLKLQKFVMRSFQMKTFCHA